MKKKEFFVSTIEISEIANYHNNLVQDRVLRSSKGTIWAQHNGNMSDMNYPWKMHLYANGYEDWYKLAQVVIPFLLKENATFKTVDFNSGWIGNYPILEENSDQFGMAFTLYPNNQAEFEKLALGLNEILQQAGLSTAPRLDNDYHNIAIEKALGPTGRIFYRVEQDENGNYVSAREAKRIAPNAPYNPFGAKDPFINLIPNQKQSGVQKEAPQKPQAEQQIKTVSDFFNAVRKLGVMENIARSADGRGGSKYFVPNNELDMEKLQNILTGLSLDYDVHYSKLFGKNVLRVLDSDFQVVLKRLDSNGVQKEAPQKPQAEQQIKTVSEFFNIVGKLGVVENIAHSADGRGGSKYFVPYTVNDTQQLEALLQSIGMKYDVHYSNLFEKNVLRVLNSDFQVAMKRIDSKEVQKDASQKPQGVSAAEKFRQGKAQADIQIKKKENGFIAAIKSVFKPR